MKEVVNTIISPRHEITWSVLNPPMHCTRHEYIAIGNHPRKDSISVGTVTNGFIVNPVKLPLSGQAYQVMEQQAGRATNFGTDEMVGLIKKTAMKVAEKYPGSIMHVANMAACGGGEIPWSVSHRSGRDVDIAFYMKDAQGHQVHLTKMIGVRPDGTGETDDNQQIFFDTARNWAMIKAIITDPDVSVQWIFIANHLKHRLLAFAKEQKEPKDIVKKAAQVMWQPYGSSAHANHIHVRIYCPVDDIMAGCRDIGSNRPWYVDRTKLIEQRVAKLATILRGKAGIDVKKQIIVTLGALGTDSARRTVASVLNTRNTSLRRAAARVFLRWGISQEVAMALPDILQKERDGLTALFLLYALKQYRGQGRCALMCRVLNIHRQWAAPMAFGQWRFSAIRFAARVLALRGEAKAIASLIKALNTRSVRDRKAVLSALRRIAARTLVFNAMDLAPKDLHDVWADWYSMHRDESRLALLVSGFAIDGALSYESVNRMSFNTKDFMGLYHRILTDPDPYNAAFLFSRITNTSMWLPRNSLRSVYYYFNRRLMNLASQLGLPISGSQKNTDSTVKKGGG